MTIKDKLKLFPWDALAHYQWASWFCTAAACVAIGAAVIGLRWPPEWAALLGAVAAVVTGVGAGIIGEKSDEKANAEAGADVHAVSRKDVLASALGCVPVAVPLLLLCVLALVR